MSGLLATTLTGSMEAIHVGPGQDGSMEVSCDQPEHAASKRPPPSTKQSPGSDDSSKDARVSQSSAARSHAETENDPSVSNTLSLRPDLPKQGQEKSHTPPDPKGKHSSTTKADTNDSDTGKSDGTSDSAPADKSEDGGDGSGSALTRTVSVKRKSSGEEEARRGSREESAKPAPVVEVSGEGSDGGIGGNAASVGRATFFVKDWEFVQTLGEGAYGE